MLLSADTNNILWKDHPAQMGINTTHLHPEWLVLSNVKKPALQAGNTFLQEKQGVLLNQRTPRHQQDIISGSNNFAAFELS